MSSSSSLLLEPLSSAMDGLKLESNESFLYNSSQCRGALLLQGGTQLRSTTCPSEEADAESFKCLLATFIPEIVPYLEQQQQYQHQFENQLLLSSIVLTVGQPVQIRLVNGTCLPLNDLVFSTSEIMDILQDIAWDRVSDSSSTALYHNLHVITWHPYRRLSFRMGRQSSMNHEEDRRVIEAACAQWLLRRQTRRNTSSLGIVGTTGKTMVLRQLIAILAENHSSSTIKFAVVSETGELYGGKGAIDIPWQANWLEAVKRAKVQILVLDTTTTTTANMTTTTTTIVNQLGGIRVVASGWRDANMVLHVVRTANNKAPWWCYRLVRRNTVAGVAPYDACMHACMHTLVCFSKSLCFI